MRKQKVIDSYQAGWSEAQYRGTPGVFNSSIAIDPDHSLTNSDIRTSGMLVPVVYEKFSSSLLIGNAKWIITNPKDTLVYTYTDNPSAGTAVELASTSLNASGNLIAYWKLENVNDSKASYTLTNNGSIPFNAAKFNNGGDLGTSNTTDYFSIGNDLTVSAGSVSFTFWIKLTTEIGSGTYTFFQNGDTASQVRHVVQYEYNAGTRRLVFNRSKTGTADQQFTYNITMGTTDFYHIAYVYDGVNVVGYVNGLNVGSVSASGSGSSGVDIDHTYIGAGRSTAPAVINYTSAIFDDFAVFNTNLSSAQVAELNVAGAKFMSYSSALTSETVIASPASGTGNGLAYYNNYIYIATNTDIGRYGPLNGTPAYTASVWTGATLGTQTALTNTVYGFQSSYAFPNHPMVVHGDGALYVCDYINGAGKIHRVKTTKTTFEGDTNNSSLYGALTLPFGFLPTDIQSYGTDLVILATQTTDTTVNQGKAALFFWDASAINFYKGPLYLPDALGTAMEVMNGQLYIWSGNAQGGVRLSKYIGGDSIQEVLFQEEGTPPPPGATSSYGNRLYWGNHITYPEDVLGVFAFGSKTERLPSGLHCVARPTNTSTTMPAITAMVPALQANGSRNRLLVAWRDSVGYGIDTYSTTGTHNAMWRSDIENVGGKFKITRIRIPLGASVSANMDIVPKVYLDDFSTTVILPTISTILYSGAKKIVYHSLELNACIGQDNFCLELNWGGTVALPVTVPIIVDYETYDDEDISS